MDRLDHVIGGYSRASSHDTRLRLVMEVMDLPYTVVTGFPGTAQINKAMLQNEVNLSGSSLPGYETQVKPQIIESGTGMALWHYPVMGADGKPVGNPELEKQGLPSFHTVYQEAFGKPPSGPKFEALLLMNDIGTRMQRAIVFPKGTPEEAVAALRQGFNALGADKAFLADYKQVTGDDPDFVRAEELEPLFKTMRNIDPEVRSVLRKSVGIE